MQHPFSRVEKMRQDSFSLLHSLKVRCSARSMTRFPKTPLHASYIQAHPGKSQQANKKEKATGEIALTLARSAPARRSRFGSPVIYDLHAMEKLIFQGLSRSLRLWPVSHAPRSDCYSNAELQVASAATSCRL